MSKNVNSYSDSATPKFAILNLYAPVFFLARKRFIDTGDLFFILDTPQLTENLNYCFCLCLPTRKLSCFDILILKHRLKANEQRPAIEVNTNYGNLSGIEYFSGQLNQVFMNILANAIDALEEANIGRTFEVIKANPNRITISTLVRDNQFQVVIPDNGIGMEEQVKQKIFDHLFTTKAVGKGTGLGLAIAQQIIVEKHNGSLTVNSTLGQGTEFVITLPILAQTLG